MAPNPHTSSILRSLKPLSSRCSFRLKLPSTRLSSTTSAATVTTTPLTSPFAPRHFLSIADLTPSELQTLLRTARAHKTHVKSSQGSSLPSSLSTSLLNQTIAMPFSKRSTRTRVSTEAAIAAMGGHPLFLGSSDIQLGVNESLYDTSVVISSMVQGIVARVGPHSDVRDMAKHSSVPVINALSDAFHPMQIIADYLTVVEAFPSEESGRGLRLEGLKIAWVGDANNVLFDLAIGAGKLGIDVAVATPRGYEIPNGMQNLIRESATEAGLGSNFMETNVPEEAIKGASIIVTDTWVSMGQEAEKAKRLKDFAGFQITPELVKRGGAKEDWRFMHCLPRHPEEVSDEVFYSPKSLVFPEAENRLWAAIAVLEAFVVNKGKILS